DYRRARQRQDRGAVSRRPADAGARQIGCSVPRPTILSITARSVALRTAAAATVPEARTRRDVLWLRCMHGAAQAFAAAALGGMLGPFLMLIGLRHLSGSAASLLLNLEAPLTMVLAVTLFREHLERAALFGALFILTGAVLLAYRPGGVEGDWLGCAAIAGAC